MHYKYLKLYLKCTYFMFVLLFHIPSISNTDNRLRNIKHHNTWNKIQTNVWHIFLFAPYMPLKLQIYSRLIIVELLALFSVVPTVFGIIGLFQNAIRIVRKQIALYKCIKPAQLGFIVKSQWDIQTGEMNSLL